MKNPPNLDLLQSRALRLPRRKRSAMIESLRTAPQRALRYGVFVDDLANAMIRAYTLGYRKNGSTLRRETRTAKLADYRKRARVANTTNKRRTRRQQNDCHSCSQPVETQRRRALRTNRTRTQQPWRYMACQKNTEKGWVRIKNISQNNTCRRT